MEVADPAMSILAEGLIDGPKSFILNNIEKINLVFSLVTCKNKNIMSIQSKISNFHTRVRAANRIGPHSEDVISVIVGSLLGDGYANRRFVEGTRLCYRQSIVHKDYLFWLYEFFYTRGYTAKNSIVSQNSKHSFNLYTFRSFNFIHKLFWKKNKLYINSILNKYISPLALTIWIMRYGKFVNGNLHLYSYVHTSKDIEILNKMLKSLYGINCNKLECEKNHFIINIDKESVNSIIKIVTPFCETYKLQNIGLFKDINKNKILFNNLEKNLEL